MHYKIRALSYQGTPFDNRDMFLIKNHKSPNRKKSTKCTYLQTGELHVVAVLDGVNGIPKGREAAEVAVEAIKDFFNNNSITSTDDLRSILNQLLDEVNKKVYTVVEEAFQLATGSTINILLFKNNHYLHANIGDSDTFLISENVVYKLSLPQTAAFISAMQGKEPKAYEYHVLKNYLGRHVIGSGMAWVKEGTFKKGDKLLLCTDGVTKAFNHNEESLHNLIKKPNSFKLLKRFLHKMNQQKQLKDNTTALFVEFFD